MVLPSCAMGGKNGRFSSDPDDIKYLRACFVGRWLQKIFLKKPVSKPHSQKHTDVMGFQHHFFSVSLEMGKCFGRVTVEDGEKSTIKSKIQSSLNKD